MNKKLVLFLMTFWMMRDAHAWTSNDIEIVLREFPQGTVHQHQMMPMRDGVRLSTHVFLPTGYQTNRYPVVLLRSAYNFWPQRASYANDVVNQADRANYTWLNTNGYVYVMQDLRGDGDSEKEPGFEPRLSHNEIGDTYDTVEALATNHWCNGRIGLYGGSGHGMAAYSGWFSKAPHLTVVWAFNTAPSLFHHWSFDHGVRRWSYDWLKYRYPRDALPPTAALPTPADYGRSENLPAWLAEGAADNPTVLIASDSWHNFFLNSTFDVFSVLQSNNTAFLSMDPGTHQGNSASNGLVFPRKPFKPPFEQPSFYRILNGETPAAGPRLKYFVMGDARRTNALGNFYRVTDHWPPPTRPMTWHFHADGRLDTEAPSEPGWQLYTYDPRHPAPSVGGHFSFGWTYPSGPFDQGIPSLTSRTDILRFVSAPMEQPLEVTGNIHVDLHLASDVPDSLFVVKVLDIYPSENGHEEYQALMRESAMMARHADGYDVPSPRVTGQIYRLEFDLPVIAWLVEPGHRIGVHITSSSSPAFEVHPNSFISVSDLREAPVAQHTVYMGPGHTSRIILPITNPTLLDYETDKSGQR